jgi:4-diphosphocytidyl-2-C-methyl-D-erythritol kinase
MAADCIELRAPAKINLWFHVLGRREDGFHEIETLMAPVSLADVLTLRRVSTGVEFRCDDPSLPVGDDNLVVRAAREFFRIAKFGGGVEIELQKNIPHGAGLGGGSSDAASTLLGLSRLYPEAALPHQTLVEIAAGIGSDVPFFLYESAAICRGRGELVTSARSEQQLPLLLLKPAFGVPTPWAYSRWRDSRELPRVAYGEQRAADLLLRNDLERPVFEKFTFLAAMKMWLLEQREVAAALMSGSGSTVFALLHDRSTAAALAARARQELDAELWSCACETL